MQHKQEVRWIQLPVRLEVSQADALEEYSKATRIPKSAIARSSIARFLADLERSGVRTALERIHSA
jgi:hypothetical protein